MAVMVVSVQAHCAGWCLGGGDVFQPNMALGCSSLPVLHNGLFGCRPLEGRLVVVASGELCKRVP